jgi:ligand-binding sensor domain-containing protein
VNVIFGIVEEGSGKMWFGSFNHGLMYYDGAVVRTVPPTESPGTVQVYDLMKDSEGNIWMGTVEQGLWKYITP